MLFIKNNKVLSLSQFVSTNALPTHISFIILLTTMLRTQLLVLLRLKITMLNNDGFSVSWMKWSLNWISHVKNILSVMCLNLNPVGLFKT